MRVSVTEYASNPEFQSAPGREAERCDRAPSKAPPPRRFNPRPAVRPSDADPRRCSAVRVRRFNPRPAVRPSDAADRVMQGKRANGFNPRPAVRPSDAAGWSLSLLSSGVSIRARP